MTDEEKIERVAQRIHEARHFSVYDLGSRAWNADLARAAIAELKAIESEEATPPAKTPAERWDLVRESYEAGRRSPATMMDEARIPRTPERT